MSWEVLNATNQDKKLVWKPSVWLLLQTMAVILQRSVLLALIVL
jgi:hypothetical protein